MKCFAPLLTALVVASSALGQAAQGQGITIAHPKDGDSYVPGQVIRLRIQAEDRFDVTQLGLGIGIQKCQAVSGTDICFSSGLGQLLYDGKLEPHYEFQRPDFGLHEIFEISVPRDFGEGKAVISVANLALTGDENAPQYDNIGVTINVQK